MFDIIANLDAWAQWLLAVGAAATMLVTFIRFIRPLWRNTKSDARAIRDTLVGREAVKDSITGEEIRPAQPGIGSRMADQELHARRQSTQLEILTNAVADMARASERLDAMERNHADLAQRVTAFEQGHHLERMAGKVESIQLLSTIETVAKSGDHDEIEY